MKAKTELTYKMQNLIKFEIEKLKNTDKDSEKIYNFLYKKFEKIFIRFAFPYFRFEILLQIINDIIKNNSDYSWVKKQDVNALEQVSNKLKYICLRFNIILDDYNKLIMYVEKNLKK